MILYLKSGGRDEKHFIVEVNGKSNEVKVEIDLLSELKEYLKVNNLELKDFSDFIPIPTESFTGYREAVTICNALKHFVLNIPVKNLTYPNYHQEPNISKPKNP